jgi:two-component system, OmpR family, phosphate regulon response regulator PhoB
MLATDTKKQILIVDRDVASVEPLQRSLAELGFLVGTITDGCGSIGHLAERPPHMLIFDWNEPGFGAVEVIRRLRAPGPPQRVRLIIMSNLSGEEHVVSGLNLGADDYIIKPYSVREVVARVCMLLRTQIHRKEKVLRCGDLKLDGASHQVTARGRAMDVHGVELRLLEFFMSNCGITFSRTQLLSQVWIGHREVDERTVDVNVQRLRKTLSASGYQAYIQTVTGFGYRFGPPDAP